MNKIIISRKFNKCNLYQQNKIISEWYSNHVESYMTTCSVRMLSVKEIHSITISEKSKK